ncbi:MAG: peptidase S24, partial [Sphingobium sp.]
MDQAQDARIALDRLIAERGENYADLSRLIGRNPAYIQQFIKRGTPRKLDEDDRRVLARYFGVSEELLGGGTPAPVVSARVRGTPAVVSVPRLSLGASAGGGT